MKGKVGRGFLFYLLLLLGIALGAFAVCVVVMIFVPDFSLFGLRAYNEKYENVRIDKMSVYENVQDTDFNEKVLIKTSSDTYTINKIEINANAHSVRVIKSNNQQGVNANQFVAVFSYQRIGFTTKELKSTKISVNYYINNKTLRINIESPLGFLNFGGGGTVFLQIPQDYTYDKNIDLIVNAKDSVVIGDSFSATGNTTPSTIDFKSVNIKTDGDIFVTKYATIGKFAKNDCSFISKKGDITVNTAVQAKDLEIETNEATVRITNETDSSFVLSGDFKLNTNNTFVHLGNFTANKSFLKNIYGKMYFKNVNSNIVIEQDSYKCDYQFENINGSLTMGSYFDEYMVENGNISIRDSITGDVVLATTGNINIEKIIGSIRLKTTTGKTNIKSVTGMVEIVSENGDIALGSEESRIVSKINVLATGNGKIDIYLGNLQYSEDGESNIKSNKGNIAVYIIKNAPLNLNVEAAKSIEYLGEKQEEKSKSWEIDEANLLIIESVSDIKIKEK